MPNLFSKLFPASATLVLLAGPAVAQSQMTPAQCDTMMMVGTWHYEASAVAGCQSYFQALADGASVSGTFQAWVPRTNGAQVVVSTSGGG